MESRVEKKNHTRRKLINCALKLSAEKGFSSLSLREVAAGADLTPAGFYRHFRDMEDLGLALLDEIGVSFRRLIRDARHRANDSEDSVETSIAVFFDYVNANANLFRIFLGERQGASPAFRKSIHAGMDQFVSELAEDLEKGFASTDRPLLQASLAAEAIVAVVFTVGAEALELPKHKQASLAGRLAEEVKMILRGARYQSHKKKRTQQAAHHSNGANDSNGVNNRRPK